MPEERDVWQLSERWLWLIDGGLFQLDLDTAQTTKRDLQFRPDHIGYLPSSDLLILDDIDQPLVRFMDPTTMEEHTRVQFPSGIGEE